jgi:hypothetical protein
MSAAWVAGSVRARALAGRRLGPARARQLAASPSLDAALHSLAATPYGRDAAPGQTLGQAQRAVAATLLWHLRVLAGWLPRDGVRILRSAAGWYELLNIDGLLCRNGADEPFVLGALETAWSRLAGVSSAAELRRTLAASPWGDPGTDDPRAIRLALRFACAERIAAAAPAARPWVSGAAAVLLAGERFGARVEPSGQARERAGRLLGSAALDAPALVELARRLPAGVSWALTGVEHPSELWLAESRCWAKAERDGLGLLRTSGFDGAPVVGLAAVLAVDAWRVQAALEMAARGGRPMEVYDAVA